MESPPRHPVAGIDYPRTFQEFDAWFGSETACREYIRRLRWPDGFVCPHCAAMGEPWEMSRSLLRCVLARPIQRFVCAKRHWLGESADAQADRINRNTQAL